MTPPGLEAREAATTLLTRVIDDGRGLDGLIGSRHGPQQFQQLSQADQALARAIVTVALRRRGEIAHALSLAMNRPPPKRARHLQHSLHVAAAQILFMDVPDSAAVNLAVAALRDNPRSTRFSGLANAVLRRLSREKETANQNLDTVELARRNLAPWMAKRLKKQYGQQRMVDIARHHMLAAPIDVTVARDPDRWAATLGGRHLFGNSVRVLDRKGAIETWPGFEEGAWWVQDAAASIPFYLFGEIEGLTALDLCAAPGGKTAQLANAGARVTALEASKSRLSRLQENLRRLKLNATCEHADMLVWEPKEPVDLVLLDAPCSSTGTVRRHPDVQWTKSPEAITQLAEVQKTMIQRAAEFVKPGGLLVFANCSVDRAEGEDLLADIKAQLPLLEPVPIEASEVFDLAEIVNRQGAIRTLPCHLSTLADQTGDPRYGGMDGFFCARFRKVG